MLGIKYENVAVTASVTGLTILCGSKLLESFAYVEPGYLDPVMFPVAIGSASLAFAYLQFA